MYVKVYSDFLGRFVLVIFGMALILFGFLYFEKIQSFKSNGVRTKGKIIDYTYLASGDYAYVYMYYVDHKKYIQPLLIGTMSVMTRRDKRRIGKYYDIIYDADFPDKIMEAHNWTISTFMCVCILFGLYLIYMSFWKMG